MSFLKKFKTRDVNAQVELLSLHIPKTAGTSFHRTLESVYGEGGVARFELIKGEPFLNSKRYEGKGLPEGTKAVHGHFTRAAVEKNLELKNIPLITWLRNPVDRVVSNYYYLAKRLDEIVDEENNHWHILEKMQKSLSEFARAEVNRNRMSKFLEGIPLEEIYFVGIVENYDRDLEYLAKKLKWPNYISETDNVSGSKSRFVPDAVRREIQDLNQIDMELYRDALERSEKRLQL